MKSKVVNGSMIDNSVDNRTQNPKEKVGKERMRKGRGNFRAPVSPSLSSSPPNESAEPERTGVDVNKESNDALNEELIESWERLDLELEHELEKEDQPEIQQSFDSFFIFNFRCTF
jgi:hypothetical protein